MVSLVEVCSVFYKIFCISRNQSSSVQWFYFHGTNKIISVFESQYYRILHCLEVEMMIKTLHRGGFLMVFKPIKDVCKSYDFVGSVVKYYPKICES